MFDSDPHSKPAAGDKTIRYVNLYASEDKIYTRKITGFYQSIRRYTGLPLLLGFLLLPWFVIDGRPAVYFDLPARQFYVFWVTFGPQEGLLLAWLLIIAAFGLFAVTALLGRVWCGFTCPQTVWTLMFIWAEHLCEGDRNRRIKLDNSAWSIEKVLRKSAKYSLWVLISFVTGATFVAYFYPVQDLLLGFIPSWDDQGMVVWNGNVTAIFWTLFFAGMTLMNAGFLREQVCKYMCPYARFQSVMYDNDTLAVHYDSRRGEPRGFQKASTPAVAAQPSNNTGDCIDCSWCVQVCPVDIDIRDGLQYECINCGLCVDACNAVMDKIDLPRGLIRFTSEDQLQSGSTHFIRWRVVAYIAALLVMIAAFSYTLAAREPVTVDVDRDRGARMYRLQGDKVQNVYTLKVHNMDRQAHRFAIHVDGPHPFRITRYRAVPVDQNEIFSFPVRVEIERALLASVKTTIRFTLIADDDSSITASEETVFIGPQ
ncbi:MAG: cytochrome c oxidase accessory protein CcoG [Cellvibrionaceae bacterium]|nr:cytochrome c oxidase accessory protein CcoG [Cellvibrionaceae bacterium]